MTDVKKSEQKHPLQEEPVQQAKQPNFRGCAIHIQADGKYGLELIGVTVVEVYGALTLVMDKMKKDLQGGV